MAAPDRFLAFRQLGRSSPSCRVQPGMFPSTGLTAVTLRDARLRGRNSPFGCQGKLDE
jgi:hypothetical protein